MLQEVAQRKNSSDNLLTDKQEIGEIVESAEEGEPSVIGDVGGKDGSNDGSDLDSGLVVQTLVDIVVDLVDEVGKVERADATREGVQQVGNSASGVGRDLVGDLSPVRDDDVESAVLQALRNSDDTLSVD